MILLKIIIFIHTFLINLDLVCLKNSGIVFLGTDCYFGIPSPKAKIKFYELRIEPSFPYPYFASKYFICGLKENHHDD